MYQVDCRQINSYEDFIESFNRALFEPAGGKWKGNLDAFNDYLAWPKVIPYQLEILGSSRCAQVLSNVSCEQNGSNLWLKLQEILLKNKDRVSVEFN
jgi:hypothetical protein